jgi:uncharacterized membrane protein YedE/YeeE
VVRNAVALAAGLLFGLGLCLSGMYDPRKVLGFLDITGAWDPSLAFVMGGAIAVALPAFALARRGPRTWSGEAIELPPTRPIDGPLALGAVVFGAGWGLSGICPGPALVDLGFLSGGAAMFVVAMAVGVHVHRGLEAGLRAGRPIAQDA